jgi:uncharacterized Zn finger protein
MSYRYGPWKPYVSQAQRRAKAEQKISRMAKSGDGPQPVGIDGSAIARSFWGKGWCRHLETFSDYSNRLPRGRSYVRSGAVCHLEIAPGRVEARVIGTRMYTVHADIAALKPAAWKALKQHCAGGIGSMIELLQGRLSEQVMRTVTDREHGLFPRPGEMKFTCSCPDWAGMCKHVAATLYGVGNRLDLQPELLFRLRGVDPAELIEAGFTTPQTQAAPADGGLADEQLGAIFGIELDSAPATANRARKTAPAAPKAGTRKAAPRPFRATAKTIAALRRKLRLSVPEFAERLSVSPASVLRWEAAGSTPLKLQARCLAALSTLQRQAAA